MAIAPVVLLSSRGRVLDFAAIDWEGIFVPTEPLFDVVIRGTIMYWALFLLLRFVIRREVGELGITDLLVVVLLADAAQNALSGDYKSIPEGIVLVAVIAGWAYLINLLKIGRASCRERVKMMEVDGA